VTYLSDAISLWEMRFLATEYLRTNDDPTRRGELLRQFRATEGASVERLTQMTPHLPLPIETPPLAPGEIHPVEVQDHWGATQQTYSVVLPPEYSPQHAYPLLVVLRPEGRTDEQQLAWWAGRADEPGPAQRRGYITIAPNYAAAELGAYEYNAEVHETVLESIRDARKRFRVDSDRIFLAGHGMGADACFDLGMSHPEVFAGVIPIVGTTRRHCTFYRRNAPDLAWYVVSGERDADSLVNWEPHATDLNDMMKQGHDIIYCEYKARGFESYYEELPRIFDWMQMHRRGPLPDEWEVQILRHTDTRFYWMEVAGLPAALAEPIVWDPPRQRRRPITMRGNITEGNSLFIRHNATHTTVWLTPAMIDFDERVRVHVNGRQAFNNFIAADPGALLEALRVSGDRERLVWARMEF
jgi:enterochelin esterase-like enzyme